MAFGYCRRLRLSVRSCVNHLLVRAKNSGRVQARITKFGPKMPNTLVEVPIFFFLILFFFFFWGGGSIDLDFQGQISLESLNWPPFELVCTITRYQIWTRGTKHLYIDGSSIKNVTRWEFLMPSLISGNLIHMHPVSDWVWEVLQENISINSIWLHKITPVLFIRKTYAMTKNCMLKF